MHGFMLKIRDFYNSERLYLLQCVKHILTYWPDPEHHPYRVSMAFLTYETEFVLFLAVLENSVSPMG